MNELHRSKHIEFQSIFSSLCSTYRGGWRNDEPTGEEIDQMAKKAIELVERLNTKYPLINSPHVQ